MSNVYSEKNIDVLEERMKLNYNKAASYSKIFPDSIVKAYNDVMNDYRENQYNKTVETLNKLSELIAFINTYGKLYDKYYEGFIINLNNVYEHFLHSSDSKVIDELYTLYFSLRGLKKSKKEIFEELRNVLYELPTFEIVETSAREKKHKKRTYSLK